MVKSLSCLVKDLRLEMTRLCSTREDEQETKRLFAEALSSQETTFCILQKKEQLG